MLSVEAIAKRFPGRGGGVVAVRDISLSVPEGAFLAVLGPSGSGKSTLLRCVAGLERPDSGVVSLDGTVVADPGRGIHVPPERRGIGMVFQSPTVWPHMTVRENVAFPLRHLPRGTRPSSDEAARLVQTALGRVRLDGLDDRPATDLSGGQQQRLALARALVGGPRVLLLDEPLSSLDAELREQIGVELRRIQQELGVTTVYVTHDRDETFALSTHVAVVRDGAVEQVGAPLDLYRRPATAFVARALGTANLIPGRVRGTESGKVLVDTGYGCLRVAANGTPAAAGAATTVVARPEHVRLQEGGGGTVFGAVFARDMLEVVVHSGDASIRARMPASAAIEPGSAVTVGFDEPGLVLVAPPVPTEPDVR